MGVIIRNICQYCGTDIGVEEEVFSGDKLFTGHSCQVVELAQKRAIDHFGIPLDKLLTVSHAWCYFQAKKDSAEASLGSES